MILIRVYWGILFLALAFASLSTKSAGLALSLLLLVGAWVYLKRPYDEAEPKSNFEIGRMSSPRSSQGLAALKTWGWALGIYACIMVGMALWWGEGLKEREEVARLGLAWLALWAIQRRWSPSAALVRGCLLAVAVTLLFAACWTLKFGGGTTTNPIPWAAGIAFLVCLLLPLVFDKNFPLWERLLYALGACLGTLAVLMSFSRGAYGIVLWGGFLCFLAFIRLKKRFWIKSVVLFFSLALGVVAAVSLPKSAKGQQIAQRIQTAAAEARNFWQSPGGQGASSSVGARLHMYSLADDVWAQSPFIGIGKEARLALIKAQDKKLGTNFFADLGHLHNEYLHEFVDYGLIGLAAILSLTVGLFLAAFRARGVLRWQLMGIGFMHATTSVTNVNLAHNYYSTLLALGVSLAFWCHISATDGETKKP